MRMVRARVVCVQTSSAPSPETLRVPRMQQLAGKFYQPSAETLQGENAHLPTAFFLGESGRVLGRSEMPVVCSAISGKDPKWLRPPPRR